MSDAEHPPAEHLPENQQPTRTTPLSGGTPTRIGPYHLLRKLGEGGMGEVYEAEQEKPLRRRVALKLTKVGMDTAQVIARFESERQALALMSHPNVAGVLDAGATEQGRPYFVMEYVGGVPITEYCDTYRLGIPERLELFIQVCDGVQHAHQKGIIHRDLKPSNILVSVQEGRPRPQIIDFGIAKATAQRLTERTFFTEMGQMIGTPEYMSPEQAELTSLDIDTRTDIYSLGAILYELLTGVLPFDRQVLRQAGYDEIRRTIREAEPPRPSRRATTPGEVSETAARNRQTDRTTLGRLLRGDLDFIAMKAMEKDRTRRYASASDLAADVARHLKQEPVQARPPSTLYRARKFIRRHKVGVAAAALIVVAMAAGTTAATIGLVRATRAEHKAVEEAETARLVSEFLVGLFETSNPWKQKSDKPPTVRELLDAGAVRIERDLKDQPLVQARLMETIGRVYVMLGLFDPALPLLERSLEIRRALLGEKHPDVATSLSALGSLQNDRGDLDDAIEKFERALAIRERALGPDNSAVADALFNLAGTWRRKGRYDLAREFAQRELSIREKDPTGRARELADALDSLAGIQWETGDFQAARDLMERALKIYERVSGPESLGVASALADLGSVQVSLDDYARATEAYDRALTIQVKMLGPENTEAARTLGNLAWVEYLRGNDRRARELGERSLAIREKMLGPDHPEVAVALQNLAHVRKRMGHYREARYLYERALAIQRKRLEPDHPQTAESLDGLADLLVKTGDLKAARPLYERALEIRDRQLGPAHPDLAQTLEGFSVLLRRTGEATRAGTLEKRAREIRAALASPQPAGAQPASAQSPDGRPAGAR